MELIVEETPSNSKIIILKEEGITAEDKAMLQALYSRDPQSIFEHLKKIGERERKGQKSFMEQFYVGYGHASIGDCAPIVIFIENISMLAAKAIQDNRLYSGQEVSTRYVDFSKQPLKGLPIVEELRAFYVKAFPIIESYIWEKSEFDKENATLTQKNSIKAATFDILRGFLPAGATTSCSWTTNIRQVNDHLLYLRAHPLSEVREIAEAISKAVKKYAPHSLIEKKIEADWAFYKIPIKEKKEINLHLTSFGKDRSDLLKEILDKRPLAPILDAFGTVEVSDELDFASFRDLQRHRAIVQFMPQLTTKLGFSGWYLSSLTSSLRVEAVALLRKVEETVKGMDPWEAQYSIPMGYNVLINFFGGLASVIYMVELRSGQTVHPTLQNLAKKIGKTLEENGIGGRWDLNPVTHISMKRGTQIIKTKE